MPTKARYAAQKAKRVIVSPVRAAEPTEPSVELEEGTIPPEDQTPDPTEADPIEEEFAEEADVVPPDDLDPSFTEVEEAEPEVPESQDEPAPGEFVVLIRKSSYGPVTIGGRQVRCKRGILYLVPDIHERVHILGSRHFRAATKADIAKSREPSSGPGGAVTRALLPPGALKGELKTVRPDVYPDEEGD